MEKYLKIFQVAIAQYFVYRLSFVLWRLRNVMSLIFIYFLWTSVYAHGRIIFTYSYSQLISYILLINILDAIVMGTRTSDIANDILNGNLANYLIKPISFFKFNIAKELTDKLINLVFAVGEITLLVLVFQPDLSIKAGPVSLVFFLVSVSLGAGISYFISLMLSFLAFWSTEIWAPRFIYIVIVSFVAGTFYPLDILPRPAYNVLLLTPFPYLVYLPSKILVSGFSSALIIPLFISFVWCLILYKLASTIWQAGIKNYSSYGR